MIFLSENQWAAVGVFSESSGTMHWRATTAELRFCGHTATSILTAKCHSQQLLSSLLNHAHPVVVEVEGIPVQDVFRSSNVTLQHVVVELVLLLNEFFSLHLGIIDVSHSCFGID